MSEVEILSCPFCGGKAKLCYSGHQDMAWVVCLDCLVETAAETGTSSDDAISLWNRRSASPSIGRVGVKALEWQGDKAETPFGPYTVIRTPDGYQSRFQRDEVAHVGFNAVDMFYGARRAAQDHAQADYESRIRSTLVYHEEPAGDTQGALAVRPLKWEPSGRYPFVAMSDYYDIGHQSGDGRYWVHHRIFGDLREGDGTIEHHLTLDAAKAAAQEDHERKTEWPTGRKLVSRNDLRKASK